MEAQGRERQESNLLIYGNINYKNILTLILAYNKMLICQ